MSYWYLRSPRKRRGNRIRRGMFRLVHPRRVSRRRR